MRPEPMSGAPTVSPRPLSVEALGNGFAKALGRAADGACEQAFIAQAHEDYADDETPEIDGDDLAAVLAAAWKAAEARPAGQPAQITTGPLLGGGGRVTPYDQIIIVQDDAPFLVDSVMGQMADAGVTVRAMFHPILDKGGRESVIIVVADPLPQERRDDLTSCLKTTLSDVHAAVADHAAMQALMGRSIAHLEAAPKGLDAEVIAENIAFLQWMSADHFVFLGSRDYDYPRTADGAYEAEAPLSQSGEGLGVLRDPQRTVLRRANEPAVLTKQMKRQLDLSEPVTVAKANVRSNVHRRAYMDYVGVKRFGPDGRPSGETRFVGLFTAEAYDRAAGEVPLVRRKVAGALARAGKAQGSHSYKRLKNILENYPRGRAAADRPGGAAPL
jgi:glutamate dehydrogenase